ncbi:hypothetical protein F8M41_025420 [Gigaspora margarita]|uniref:Apple domain-containing protein n=1 Tax=Gigaspora margarita TaxID=4874 RepID=A0A8H3XIQ3_GIGMA|nr:hypothetical protein F8M41_025420 [Gigaspora margarita]
MNPKHLIAFLCLLAFTLAVPTNNKYDECHTQHPTPTPTPKYCQYSGGLGWENKVHAFTAQGVIYYTIDSPQACCESCANIPKCVQWVYVSNPAKNICRNFVLEPTVNTCNFNEVNTIVADGGVIHCDNAE